MAWYDDIDLSEGGSQLYDTTTSSVPQEDIAQVEPTDSVSNAWYDNIDLSDAQEDTSVAPSESVISKTERTVPLPEDIPEGFREATFEEAVFDDIRDFGVPTAFLTRETEPKVGPIPADEADRPVEAIGPREALDITGRYLSGSGVPLGIAELGKASAWVGKKFGQLTHLRGIEDHYIQEEAFWREKEKDFTSEKYSASVTDNPWLMLDPGYLNYHLGRMSVPVIAGGGASKALQLGKAGSQLTSAAFMSAGPAVDTYEEVLKATDGNELVAARAAGSQMIMSTVLEKFGFSQMIRPVGNVLARGAKGYITEFGTEFTDEFFQSVNKDVSIWAEQGKSMPEIADLIEPKVAGYLKNSLDSGLTGGLIGKAVAITTGSKELKAGKLPTQDEATTLIDKISNTPRDRVSSDQEATDFLIQFEKYQPELPVKSAAYAAKTFEGLPQTRAEEVFTLFEEADAKVAAEEAQRVATGQSAIDVIEGIQVRQPTAEESARAFTEEGTTRVGDILDQLESLPETKQATAVAAAIEDTKDKHGKVTLSPENVETTSMTSDEFLRLSTKDDKTVERVRKEGFKEEQLGIDYQEGDPREFQFDKDVAAAGPGAYLIVGKDGKVKGHEGRHRAVFSPDGKLDVTIIYEGDVQAVTPQFPLPTYTQPSTGRVVTTTRSGEFQIDTGEIFPTQAQANRALVTGETAIGEVTSGFEDGRQVAVVGTDPERLLESKATEDLVKDIPTVSKGGDPLKPPKGRRRIVKSTTGPIVPIEGIKDTGDIGDKTSVTTKGDTIISASAQPVNQVPEKTEKIKDSKDYRDIVDGLMSGDLNKIDDAMGNLGSNSLRKYVLRAAIKDAEAQAVDLGSADINMVIETGQEASIGVFGRKHLAGQVEMQGDGRGTGLYTGTDTTTGTVYTAFKVDGKYTVLAGKEIFVDQGPKNFEQVLPLIEEHSKGSVGFTATKITKGHKDWTITREQVKVYDADGNVVKGFNTKKEASAFVKSKVNNKVFVPGDTVVKRKETPKGATSLVDAIAEEATETELPTKKKDDRGEVTKVEITPEMLDKYTRKIQRDLTGDERLEITMSEGDIEDMNTEVQGGSLATLRGFLPKSLQGALDIAEKALQKSPRGLKIKIAMTPSLSAGQISLGKGDNPNTITVFPIHKSGNYRGVSYMTVLHEVYHHISADLLITDPTFAKDIEALRQALIKAANLSKHDQSVLDSYDYEVGEDILSGTVKVDNFAIMYGLSSNQEFIGNMINDTDFRKLASEASVPGKKKLNHLQKFIQLFKDSMVKIGLMKKGDSILDATLGAVDSAWDGDVKNPIVTKGIKGIKLASSDFNEQRVRLKAGKVIPIEEDGFLKGLSDKAKAAYRIGFRGIDNALGDIHPYLKSRFKDYNATTEQKTLKRTKAVTLWAKGFKSLDADTFNEYRHALLNFQNEDARTAIEEIHKANPELESFDQVKKVLSDMTKDMTGAGLIPKGRKYYFPNKVKNLQGLMDHMAKEGEGTLLAEVKADLGPGATQAEIKDAMSGMLSRGVYPAMLNRPGSAKSKTIWDVSPEMMDFYSNPVDALLAHIDKATKSVEQHKMVGKSGLGRLETIITDLRAKKSLTDKEKVTLAEAEKDILLLGTEMEGNIGEWIAEQAAEGKISGDQQQVVRDLLHSHFNEQPMNRALAKIKTLGTIGAIGSFTSTIAQIPDLAGTLHKNGYRNTIGALMNRNKLYTRDDIVSNSTLEQIGEADTLQKVLKGTLWATGFTQLDTFFKDLAMDAALRKAKNLSLDKFREKHGDIYNDKGELERLYKDIHSDTKSDVSMRFAFNSLAEVQPISTAQMPEFYAKHPTLRMIYTLKSFAIKILNNIHSGYQDGLSEGFGIIKPGHPAAAAKTLAYVATLVALGAPVGYVQELMQGGDPEMDEEILDALLVLIFQSRYSATNITEGKISDYIANLFTPPAGWLEKPLKDIYNLTHEDRDNTWKFVSEIPVAGKLVHKWYSQETAKKRARDRREKIFTHYKSMLRHGSNSKKRGQLRGLIQEFNRDSVKMGVKKITRSSLDRAKRTYRLRQKASKQAGIASVIETATELLSPKEAYATTELGEDSTGGWINTRHKAVLVGNHTGRLGVDYEESQKNLTTFARLVGMIENNGKTVGKNKPQKGVEATTASGLYQFVANSVEPAVNRLKRHIGTQQWMIDVLKSKDAGTLTREQQTLLFLADLLEKDGSDAVMKRVMQGDKMAMREAYYKLHHTKPDEATIARAEKIIAK